MSVTTADTQSWKSELDRLIETSSAGDVEALTQLKGALDPYFEQPESFNTLLSKIQRTMMSSGEEEKLTTSTFNNLSEVEASLPRGITVSAL